MVAKITRKKIIITVVILVLLLGGAAAAYYAITTDFFSQLTQKTDSNAGSSKTGTAYRKDFEKTEAKVSGLIISGDEKSIKEAEKLINSEVDSAKDSGNDAYIVDASIAKASLLRDTGRAQEALDSVLSSLDKKYSGEDAYKDGIYVALSMTYRELGDTAKADEYINKAQGRGGD